MTQTFPESAQTVDDLIAVLRAGERVSGEGGFSLLDHGLQCAAVLRAEAPADQELQLAGLLHDIGHTLVPGDDAGHGIVGGNYVRRVLGERVADLIELHVPAKRYLVTVEPSYQDTLSAVSAQTLINQGAAMNTDEVQQFAGNENSADAIALRRADEDAKVAGLIVDPLEAWRPVFDAVAARVTTSS